MSDATAIRVDTALRRHLDTPDSAPVRVRNPFRPSTWQALSDLAVALSIVLLAIVAHRVAIPGAQAWLLVPWQEVLGIGLLAGAVFLVLAVAASSQGRHLPAGMSRQVLRAASLAITAVLLTVLWTILFWPDRSLPQTGTAALWALLSAAAATGLALCAAQLGAGTRRVAVVGDGVAARALAAATCRRYPGCLVVARLRDDEPADLALLNTLIVAGSVDEVVLAIPPDDALRIGVVCDALADCPVQVSLGLDPTLQLGAAGASGGVSLVELWCHPLGGVRQVAKRCFDVMMAVAALSLLGPLLLAIAALIRLETPGPVLFRQWRFGLGSVPFQCCKFRTMHAHRGDPTGEERTAARDPRVTRLGRFLRRTSLDEMPQLINVLRGDMSLVGPRPHPLHMRVEGAYYFEAVENYRLRHRVKPGITGWAQINGSRGEVATLAQARRRVMLDIEYVRNWSFTTDLRIVLRTIFGGFITRAD